MGSSPSGLTVSRIPQIPNITKWFPFHIYSADGSQRLESLTDQAFKGFQSHYLEVSMSKWEICHYAEVGEAGRGGVAVDLPKPPQCSRGRAPMVSGLNGGFDRVHDGSKCLFQNMTKAELQGLESPLIGPYRYARLVLPCDTQRQPWPYVLNHLPSNN